MNKKWILIVALVIINLGVVSWSQAQTHKGISFQGVIKLPNGDYPTRSGLTVNSRVLSPNNCILREEQFEGVNVSNGYINIAIGTGATGGYDPSFSMKQVMDNSAVISGLTCLNSDGTVNPTVTSFNPATTTGARKFRLSLTIDSTPIVADFNMRAMAYAINAESLNGKTENNFINTSSNITQAALESWFASAVMGQILGSTYVAPSATTANNVSGVVAIANGGTGATSATAAVNNLLPNQAGNAGKVLTTDGSAISWVAPAAAPVAVTSVAGKTGDVTLEAADIADFGTATNDLIAAQKGVASGLAPLDGSGKIASTYFTLSAADIPSLDAGKITSGTITQNVNSSSVGGTTGSFTNLRIYDGTSEYLTMSLPSGGAGYSLKWPNAVGSNGQVLQTDALGNLSWVALPAAPVTSVAGKTGAVTLGFDDLTGTAATAQLPVVPVSKGGTGASSLTANRLLASDGTGSSVVPFSCGVGQLLTFDASGIMGCTAYSSSGVFANGGNSFGATAVLGTNDSNDLSFKTSNATRMTLTAAGELGIGIQSPSSRLHVQLEEVGSGLRITDASAAGGYFSIGEGGSTANTFTPLIAARPVGATRFTGFYSDAANGEDTGSTPLLVLAGRHNTGNVTTRPILEVRNNTTPLMTVLAGGKVGVGISSPTYKMQIEDDVTDTESRAIVTRSRSQVTTSGNYAAFGADLRASQAVASGATNTGATRGAWIVAQRNNQAGVNDNGSQGLIEGISVQYGHYSANPTATPLTTDVRGVSLNPYYSKGSIENLYDIYIGSGASGATVNNHYSIYQEKADAKNYFAGNVGIGTTAPAAPLEVAGVGSGELLVLKKTSQLESDVGYTSFVRAKDSAGTNVWYVGDGSVTAKGLYMVTYQPDYSIFLGTNAGTAMTILNNNNVGIGTTSPNYKLHVVGTAGATVGYFSDSSQSCSIRPSTAGNISCSSDERLKKNIEPVDDVFALENILKLQTVTYEWRSVDNGRHTGYIAQEVEKIAPEFVTTGSDGLKQVSYTGFIPLITGAIKELHNKLLGHDEQLATQARQIAAMAEKKELEILKKENAELRARLDRVEKMLESK